MPTYEYICENCGYKFERSQSIKAGPLRKCEKCGRMKLKRLIGAGSGVIFKGSGFYQTDYRSDSYKKAQSGEKNLTSKIENKDSKPAPKTDPEPAEKPKPDKKKTA
jgi:putative FmdB family regulatory protein